MQQIRTIISVLATMTNLACFCQTNAANDITNKIARPAFYLYYAFSGLGSNLGSFQPTIKIHDTFTPMSKIVIGERKVIKLTLFAWAC
jgi:hypothetical protein